MIYGNIPERYLVVNKEAECDTCDEVESEEEQDVCEDCGTKENEHFRAHWTEAWLCKKCYEKRDKYPNADDYDCASDDAADYDCASDDEREG